ncbi:hypothetical protein Ccrd_022484, partial [Cynara cardunculus var. scolymus]
LSTYLTLKVFCFQLKNSIIYSYHFWCHLETDSPPRSSLRSRSDPKTTLQGELTNMGRGVSSGGGQSSLNYLFGSGGEPKPTTVSTGNAEAPTLAPLGQVHVTATTEPPPKPAAAITPPDIAKQIPAGIQSSKLNNYTRADGQNTGNFLTGAGLPWVTFLVAVATDIVVVKYMNQVLCAVGLDPGRSKYSAFIFFNYRREAKFIH